MSSHKLYRKEKKQPFHILSFRKAKLFLCFITWISILRKQRNQVFQNFIVRHIGKNQMEFVREYNKAFKKMFERKKVRTIQKVIGLCLKTRSTI